jgi:MFS family permease
MYGKFCLYGFLKNLKFFDPFLILFFRESGLSFFEIGVLFSIREISTNIIEIPSGIAADIFGRRSSMVVSFAAYIASFIVFYLFPSFVPAIFAMIIFSVGEAFRTGTHKAMILTYLELNGMQDQKVMFYGRTRSWSVIGSAVSSVIAAFIVFYSGSYKYVFLFSAIPYVAGLVLMLSYPKELDGVKEKGITSAKEIMTEFFRMMQHPKIIKPVLRFSLFHGTFKSVKDYIQPAILALALSLPVLGSLEIEKRTSVFAGAVYCILYLLASAASRNSHRITKKNIHLSVVLGFLYLGSTAVLIFIGAFANIPALMIGLFILLFLVMNIIRPIQVGLMGSLIKSKVFASGLSVESQTTSLMTAVIAPVFGLLVDKIKAPAAFISTGVFLMIVFLILPSRSKEEQTK